MARVTLTAARLRTLTTTKVQQDFWDEKWRYPGSFGVRVAKTGRKTFTLLEYLPNGKRRRHKLGTWPQTTLEEAVQAAERIARRNAPGSMLVEDMADRMLRKLQAANVTRSTLEQRRANLKHILPSVGKLRVHDVTTGMLQRLVDDAELEGLPGRARNILSTLRALFADAVRLDQHDYDPSRGVRVSRENMRGRRRDITATIGTLARVWKACEEVERESDGTNRQLSLVLRAQMLTAQRSRVVLQMRREHVSDWWDHPGLFDVDGRQYRTKSGRPLSVWVSPRLRELFEKAEGGEWMWWNGKPERSYRGDFLVEIRDRAGLDLDDWRPHDCRAVCATTLDRDDVPLDHYQRLLDHARPRSVTTTHYVRWRSRDPIVRTVQEAWEAHLTAAFQQKTANHRLQGR